ncbi:MAG: RsmD family RNA methyltransferase [Nanoarchaeota archaeon]
MKTKNKNKKIQRSFDLLGNIALVKFSDSKKLSKKQKKDFAKKILKEHKSVETILEKTKEFSGKLRTMKTSWLLGEKNKEVLYKENNCEFRFNIDTSYFSPRLSNDRKEITEKISMLPGKNKLILVMFAGVGPYSIEIAKNSKGISKVVSNELNNKANEYSQKNSIRNKVEDKIEFCNGDIKKKAEELKKKYSKGFDIIVMPRPNIEEDFIKEGLLLSKKLSLFEKFILREKPTRIFYHSFGREEEMKKQIKNLKKKSKKFGRKLKIIDIKKVGDIAPYKFRFRLEFEVL